VLPQGRRDDRLVSLVDVFATVLDLAGAEPPAESQGRSLLPLLSGRGDFAREHVFGGGTSLREDGFAPDDRPGPRQHAWYLRTPEWRYVFAGRYGRESLYRIEEDPGEARDVAAEDPEVLVRLRKALLAEIEAMDRAASPRPR
jgi:arylsulfatase A-like enzyme